MDTVAAATKAIKVIPFKEYITEADERVKLLVALDTQKDRIEAAVKRNMKPNTKGAYNLQDKYNELKDKAEDAGVWELFCSELKLSSKHDARDFWA